MSVQAVSTKREYFDLRYSSEPASYYYLLLEIDGRQLKAGWYHLSKNLVTGFANYPLNTEKGAVAFAKLLADHPFLKSEFKQTIVTVRSDNYSLIPKGHDEPDLKALFEVTNSFDAGQQILVSRELINLKATLSFALDTTLAETIRQSFFHPVIVPHLTPRIESVLNLLKSRSSEEFVTIHVSLEHVDIMVYQGRKLVLANSFFQSGKEDIAYYVLYCSEVLGINTETVELCISGEVEIADECWQLLSSYWRRITLDPGLSHVQVSDQLDMYPKGHFDYITHHLLCAS